MFLVLICFSILCDVAYTIDRVAYQSVEKTQQQNLEILTKTLPLGWHAFCNSAVDEGVMSLYSGINPSDASIYILTLNNQSVELPIKSLSEVRDFDINPKRKTLLYINAHYTPDSLFSVQSHLQLLQVTRRDLNIIYIDFAKSIEQLYYGVRHHVPLQGYFVEKILAVLVQNGVQPQDITLAGHSVGANIAALGAKMFNDILNSQNSSLGQLVAIDPAQMCQSSDVHVQSNVTRRVIVIHSEGEVFGIRSALGDIDIYPNGVRRKYQPGCDTKLCSHMYSFVLFMEALIERVMIPAVKCDSWTHFRKEKCDLNDKVVIGLTYPENATGRYYCVTQPNPPFTFMEHGLKYKKKKTTKSN